ncbi:MAG: hypothetical protein Q8L98_02950 [Chlamydiales bacterium]|nr:hypothetical protein [Chlamydiales bacterium]
MSATIPRFSDNGTLESATRSLLRMQNLTAVRGAPGASMIGPVDYLGNLEEPHKYLYTITNQFPPLFHRKLISVEDCEQEVALKKFDSNFLTIVKANWVSGKDSDVIQEKKLDYQVTKKHLRQSLFLDPGLLEMDRQLIELKYFDPRGIDLSSFKARLVNNQIPFQITKKELPSKDDYRLVTYLYEPLYADWQIQNGSGLFLERHRFSQTITPLTVDAKGYVVLARTNQSPDELELIGVQIPYGYTLVIEEDCIHGDTTLNGFFMMGMTSDHTTMRTADTVFLKYPETKENAKMIMLGAEYAPTTDISLAIPPPYVIYKNADEKDKETFRQLTDGQNFIFTPFSRAYWQK